MTVGEGHPHIQFHRDHTGIQIVRLFRSRRVFSSPTGSFLTPLDHRNSHGNLVDVDLDCAETVALAPQFLPETEWIFGRPSKRNSHWLYRAEPLVKTAKFADPTDNAMLVEVRSTGCQTVFPPSVHPSGESITFDRDGEPAKLEGTKLRGRVAMLAAGGLLARHWPEKGSRNDTALALGGALIEAGWPQEDAAEFIRVIAETAGDEEANHRAQTVDNYRYFTPLLENIHSESTDFWVRNSQVHFRTFLKLCYLIWVHDLIGDFFGHALWEFFID